MNDSKKPWYRQLTPWLLLAGPIIVIVAGIYTAYLAASGDDGLVVDDYYKQGKAINQMLTRDKTAAEAGIEASLILGKDGKSVRVLLNHNDDFRPGDTLTLRFQHPTKSEADIVLPLKAQAPRVYQTNSPLPLSGRWYVSIEETRWRVLGEWDTRKADMVALKPNAS